MLNKQHSKWGLWRFVLLTVLASLAIVSAAIWSGALTPNPGFERLDADDISQETQSDSSDSVDPPAQSEPQPEPEPEPVTFVVVAGGDILTHIPVTQSAWNGETYDFSGQMEPVSEFLQGADLALCNMEVPLGEPGAQPVGFPMFAAPYGLPVELAKAGWDGCSTSSNHSVDQGYNGLVRTIEAFEDAGLGVVGTARSWEEADAPQYYQLEKDGRVLEVAHLAFAHNLNGLPMPADAPWAINLNDVDKVLEQAEQARLDGADLVIVSYHCCDVEYTAQPEPLQVETAERLAASGLVDILISHHAHVPKTIDLVPGGPSGEGMWAAYGTGNFISNQDYNCCVEQSASGLLISFDVLLEPDGQVTVPSAAWTAVTVDREGGHRVVLLTENGADVVARGAEEMQRRHAQVVEVLEGSPAQERQEPAAGGGQTTVVKRG